MKLCLEVKGGGPDQILELQLAGPILYQWLLESPS